MVRQYWRDHEKKEDLISVISAAMLFVLFLYCLKVFNIGYLPYNINIHNFEEWTGRFSEIKVINRVLIPSFFVISLCLVIFQKKTLKELACSHVLVCCYCVVVVVLFGSIFVSDHHHITARRSVFQLMLIATLIFLVYLIPHLENILRTLAAALLIVLVIDIAFILFEAESFNADNEFRGIHGHKNAAGNVYLIASVLFLHLIIDRSSKGLLWIFLVISCCMCTALLFLSQSKTAIGSGVGYLLIYSLQKYFRRDLRSVLYPLLYLFCISLSVFWMVANNNPAMLTSRGEIWNFVSDQIAGREWWGYGFNSFWAVGESSPNLVYGESFVRLINTAHNGYIDVFLGLGLVGSIPIMIIGLILILCYIKYPLESHIYNFMLVTFLISNLTESFILYFSNIMWVLVLLFCLEALRKDSNKKRIDD